MIDNFVNNKYNYKDRYIENPKFSTRVPARYNLSDVAIVYNDGRKYKIVPQNIIMNYPILHDKYYDDKQSPGIISDITVTYCPFTASSITYFGNFEITDKVFNSNIVLRNKDDKDKLTVQLTGNIYSASTGKFYNTVIRKGEVKIMNLRNAISKYPDSLYLDKYDKYDKYDSKMILDSSYNTNNKIFYSLTDKSSKYHPKTLIYGIEYLSARSQKEGYKKYSTIVSKDASKDKANSRNITENGYNKYFDKMMEKIRDKGGIIIPCYWFSWYAMHPKAKVIKL
jgi:hypothetical protein